MCKITALTLNSISDPINISQNVCILPPRSSFKNPLLLRLRNWQTRRDTIIFNRCVIRRDNPGQRRGVTKTMMRTAHLIIAAGSGVIGRSVRDSRLLSHRQLHRTSSQGCWQQPPLVIRRPQPSARPARRWNWTTRASEASRRAFWHSGIRRTQYAYFYGTRSFGLCVTMKLG
jgi:hypothetical protein